MLLGPGEGQEDGSGLLAVGPGHGLGGVGDRGGDTELAFEVGPRDGCRVMQSGDGLTPGVTSPLEHFDVAHGVSFSRLSSVTS